jgi:gliding motility-associated-like protein
MKILESRKCLTILLLALSFQVYGVTAKFSYTILSNCSPTIVTFTNSSTQGKGITYTWDFGLGSVSSTTDYSSMEQVYSKPGQYTVTLKVSDGTSTDIASSVITINQGPSASFITDRTSGCPPMTVNFTSTSTAGDAEIASTLWDFRTGETEEGTSVKHTYSSTGIYDIILKVTDKNGCSSVLEDDKLITVADKPSVDFTASDTFACSAPLIVSFTNLSSGSTELNYKWDFGNGSTSTDFSNSSVYTSDGSYDVKLKATDQNGCSDSLVKKTYINVGYKKGSLIVYDGKNNAVSRTFLCDGTYKFVYTVSGLPDYTWTVTDNDVSETIKGTDTLTYKVTGSGKISIKLVYGSDSYCTDSISASFTKSYIKAGFSMADTLFCSVPSELTVTNSSVNANIFSWYLSDSLISNNKNTTYTITGNDLPAETYQQKYSHGINYIRLPVKLVASNNGICYDSITSEVTIAMPVARFMPDKVSGCVPLLVTFSDSSKSVFDIDSYTYTFGTDSVTVTSDTPVSYTFKTPGEYYVTETIKSGSCKDVSEVVKVAAGDKLVPDFTVSPDEICNGGDIHLIGSTDRNGEVDIWRFISSNLFDLSFTSTPDTTFAIYSDTTGFKDVSLSVDYNGCVSETIKKNVLKIKGPAGNFTESFSCDSSLSYRFKSQITPATSLVWNIDTIVVNDKDSVDYVFPSSGDYPVKLTASDIASGCQLSRLKTIKVRNVAASFTINDSIFCAGDTVHVISSSSKDYIHTCYNEGFLWDFGDDSPPKRTYKTTWDHIYSSRGTDTISLVVTADNGCTDTTTRVVRVYRPTGSFTTDKTSGCTSEMTIKFNDTSTDTTIVSWIWNFGDTSVDSTNAQTVSHTYTSSVQKTYYPALTVYDAYQCYSSYSFPLNMTGVNSDFQADDNAICSGETVTFNPADSTLGSMLWNFGDGTPSATTNTHTYTAQGKYTVSLTATKDGCTGTTSKEEYISVEKADAGFNVSDSVFYCYPDTVTFVHTSSSGSEAVSYLWTFDSNTLTDQSSDSVTYAFTRPGKHKALLTIRTLNGCTASSSKTISVSGPDAVVTFTPDNICYNELVHFTVDSLDNVDSWKLLFGDGGTSTLTPVDHRYKSKGKIVPLIALKNSTCSTYLTLDTLYISQVEAGFNSADSSLTVCYGNKLSLLNQSQYSSSWKWAVDGVQTSTSFNLSNILFAKTGNYDIRLIASDSGGCSDTLTKTFTVEPIPEFTIEGDTVLCSGVSSVTLSVNSGSGTKIKWNPASWLSSTSAFSVTASPTETITYTATVTNTYGCSTSNKKTILVNEPIDFTRSPAGDTTIYLGQKVQLKISTSSEDVEYSWTPHSNITCTHCNDPWVSPKESTTYSVEMKDGCFDYIENFIVNVISDFYLEAPSAFTPNGDSNNDVFRFESKNISVFDLKIFNRWGEIVFSTNDVNEGWDGNVNGHPQNIDTYKYVISAETIHGYRFERKGEFLLLK